MALALGSLPAVASGTEIECGSTITESVTLAGDLHCETAGSALTIAASDVTLDLGGHTISGAGTASGIFVGELANVVVRNGTIRDVRGHAVFLGFTVDSALHDLRIIDFDGVWAVEAGHRTTITGTHFERAAIAVSLFFGGDALVRGSTFVDNRYGVFVEDRENHVVRDNRFVGNERGVLLWDAGHAPGAVRDTTVVGNRFEGNEIGLELRAELGTIGSEIARNRFRDNRGSGMLVTAISPYGGAIGTVVAGNHFDRNGFDPPEITRQVDDTGPEPEFATFLADDGLTVVARGAEAAGITVADNRAFFNADLGIDAPGVTDGGGNHGRHNGDPAQCDGVRCQPGGR